MLPFLIAEDGLSYTAAGFLVFASNIASTVVQALFGGVATPVLGRVADQYGLWAALAVLACVPLVSAGLALTLPRPAIHASTRA